MEKFIKSAVHSTPDPERARKNLEIFCEKNPDYIDKLRASIESVSLLFSYSQFLSVFCILNPDILFRTLENINDQFRKDSLTVLLRERFISEADHMKAVRMFRKEEMLKITLRDILKKTDIAETMLELSLLADVIVDESLKIVKKNLTSTYGTPEQDALSVISLGKLGSEELNFSSDIDLIFVYGNEQGETSGITTMQGIRKNRINNHEYYCRAVEVLSRMLSLNTEDSFAYRVDLRLRPEGQKGSLAQSLTAYEIYYESWGRAWERAMLLRARPIAGDKNLGEEFIKMIEPFVYRKYLDHSSIHEIREIKTKINSTFKKDDIKRGYGGIREIEFFIHALQLIYGGREPLLREKNTLKTLHKLLQKNLIGNNDFSTLSENYVFLRTLEHRLQQLNDLQTYSLPSDKTEIAVLGKKMGFSESRPFLSELETRRGKTRGIYDSLFKIEKQTEEDEIIASESRILFDEEFSEAETREYLSAKGLKDIEKCVRIIQQIKNTTYHFQTLKGRRILSEILPAFVDAAIKSSNPDMSLNHLQPFSAMLSERESYLDIFIKNRALIPLLINIFSQSEYLSKTIIRRPDYLEMIGQQIIFKKTLRTIQKELRDEIQGGLSLSEAIRLMKQVDDARLGILYLQKKIDVITLVKQFSKTAEAILSNCLETPINLCIIGFGKLGGREITFNSDIDIIFITKENVTEKDIKTAERLLRLLISYTREGIAYKVDTRLRPDGTRGPLVSSIQSLTDYYRNNAAFWELQALLKARPVGGDIETAGLFMNMRKDILLRYGPLVSSHDIKAMRERIRKELSKEGAAYDIKLGEGGIEELEFTVQFLQLKNCRTYPSVLVQDTLTAIKRLRDSRVINKSDKILMYDSYIFYRNIESYLRLRGQEVLAKDDTEILDSLAGFIGLKNKDDLLLRLKDTKASIKNIYELLVS
ncbi:MAG: bifunctional [glutamate--ammonia ligase]-adenylyl-L-tyrosine phosphorylase/[glutamate--ammonia-ligase] adenylyltransferase [Nitrospiraceae bacterium]|nr:bifunctional [glutamate--ammonia ligase]-adenylyl-L-tyrosine phosphorylase/[glutamate--ammonia-ligase] adenylyltransferase [Nitrospiraceae bacterium]